MVAVLWVEAPLDPQGMLVQGLGSVQVAPHACGNAEQTEGLRDLVTLGRDVLQHFEGLSVKEASLLLRGAPGSSFSLRLQDWNAPSPRDVLVTRGEDEDRRVFVNRCEFSLDGRWLAVTGDGDTVIYDTDTWRPSLYLGESSGAVMCG